MKRYSIAMIAPCPFPANYGTPGAIREMCETLSARGHQVHIITYPFGEDLPIGTAKLWRPWYWSKSSKLHAGPSCKKILLDLFLLLKVLRVVRSEKIDLIHGHNYEGALIGWVAKLFTGKPLVYNAVNLMADELPTYGFIKPAFLAGPIARFLDRIVTRIPDYFITVTKNLGDALQQRGAPAGRITFVACGVKTAMFDGSNGEALRARHEVGQRPVVMYTGINSPFQRIDHLLRAFSLTLQAEPTALLMVVSPLKHDPDLAPNRELAESLGISQSVRWIEGQTLAELPDYLAMANVTAISRPEVPGHPIKLLNYMAAAKPIVCFEGAAKGVRHMKEAYVVPDHDWQALGRGIVALMRNPELATRLGQRAKQVVARDFDWSRLCAKVEHIYDGLMAAEPVALELERVRTPRRRTGSFAKHEPAEVVSLDEAREPIVPIVSGVKESA
ncbi:MAG TPA: glycosyltransferase family 4 protein [Candidatus Binataceae bacterium]|nr:glycosyltransferase family 4 protein [Candidatus Binataceae bacterium]